MTFISYAQNFEDVMLWRALKHVECGFYIDVGANDPTIESVTKAFYERGWSGINIEPLPSHHADLQSERSRDINLQCAASAEAGEIDVWECDVRGWATADADVVSQHSASGHDGVYHRVPALPLKDICSQYVKNDIHFLKIDVEGFEKNVIDGMDFCRFRPWILIIEATKPNSPEEVYTQWEPSILLAEYSLAYTDGLNRFYVANEHPELLGSLRHPPNVFDHFIRADQLRSELRAQQSEAEAQQAEAKAQQAEATSNQALTQLQAVYASTSWHITRPLRWVGIQLKLLKQHGVKGRRKAFARKVLPHLIAFLRQRPTLKKYAVAAAYRLGIAERLRRLYQPTSSSAAAPIYGPDIAPELHNLTPHARQIYSQLKNAIENKKAQN